MPGEAGPPEMQDFEDAFRGQSVPSEYDPADRLLDRVEVEKMGVKLATDTTHTLLRHRKLVEHLSPDDQPIIMGQYLVVSRADNPDLFVGTLKEYEALGAQLSLSNDGDRMLSVWAEDKDGTHEVVEVGHNGIPTAGNAYKDGTEHEVKEITERHRDFANTVLAAIDKVPEPPDPQEYT